MVLAGLTNTYSSYITTWEEYHAQRYEAASTIFGPSTLDAYIQVALGVGEHVWGSQGYCRRDSKSQSQSSRTPYCNDNHSQSDFRALPWAVVAVDSTKFFVRERSWGSGSQIWSAQ